jgi:hypothetical protein
VSRFGLNTTIEDEEGNLEYLLAKSNSFPWLWKTSECAIKNTFFLQSSLVSLARALVKNAKNIILDEATGVCSSCSIIVCSFCSLPLLCSSVYYETDRKIQDTIAYEFKNRTILFIARESNEPFALTPFLMSYPDFARSPTYNYVL